MSHTMDRNALVTSGCDTRGLSSVERELDRVSPVQKGGIERDPFPIEREWGKGIDPSTCREVGTILVKPSMIGTQSKVQGGWIGACWSKRMRVKSAMDGSTSTGRIGKSNATPRRKSWGTKEWWHLLDECGIQSQGEQHTACKT